jgi:hypothetical protein
MAAMQLIQPRHLARPGRGPFVMGTVVGGVLLFGGLALTWVAVATPVVRGLTPNVVRPAPDQMLVGALVWGLSLVAPPAFAIVGAIRLSLIASSVFRRPPAGAVSAVADQLGDEFVVAPIVHLPDGRPVKNLVVGPFGMAVISELPSPKVLRRHGTSWELRRYDGRWVPLENPLERAARDAERVKRWVATEERDFVVRVYAAVISTDTALSRTPTCAVLQREQIPAWLASLPVQRSLNEYRRTDLVERLTALA